MTPARRPMRFAAALAIAMLAGALSACAPAPSATTTPTAGTAPTIAREAVAAPVVEPADVAAPAAQGSAVQAPPAQVAAATPSPSPTAASRATSDTAATPSTSASLDDRCRSDADCAVKDVGSCCGYNPRCVAKSSQPDPAAVRARCAAEGRVGTCGFREVAGCQCTAGHCAAVADPAMEIVR
jgi:hypothetical protein